MSKTPQELYQEREKRVMDAIALKKPDRVPVLVFFGFFPARYTSTTAEDIMYDPDKLWKAYWKVLTELSPDMSSNPYSVGFLGPLLGALDFKQLKWPGHGIRSDVSYQFVEGEYMKTDEYDHFLQDPTDFIMRRYWPRISGSLKGFEKLPPLHNIISHYMGITKNLSYFSLPEIEEALDALKEAGRKSAQIVSYAKMFTERAKEAGFPEQFGTTCQAPFDTLGDFLRGTKGLMLDIYRKPDVVRKACEKLLPFMIEMATEEARAADNPRVFIPVHKGIDQSLSVEQFQQFFWPTMKELLEELIRKGLVPCPFWEGDCVSKLDIIKDIPEGKACYAFEATDIIKAKEILGGRVCIRGNLPVSLLATGKPKEVKDYCKKLIDTVGKDGGYIMDASANLDDAKPENVKALFEFTRDYGVY